jgi:ribosome-associated toxin RatA of RatAB toxin-antitoxin module
MNGHALGPMPAGRRMTTVDELVVRAPRLSVFDLAVDVARWPEYLPHYRYVRFRERAPDGGGIVEMSANRPFGSLGWPTWWVSEMELTRSGPGGDDAQRIRFRHIEGVTRGMEVEWSFAPVRDSDTRVRIVHSWNGPSWPLIGALAARAVIGPVFVHGIASLTLAGLGREAERRARQPVVSEVASE